MQFTAADVCRQLLFAVCYAVLCRLVQLLSGCVLCWCRLVQLLSGCVLCCADWCSYWVAVCCAVLCCAVLSSTVLFCALLCCAVLCCAVLCCAVLCCAVLCCAVLCCAVLCLLWCAVLWGVYGIACSADFWYLFAVKHRRRRSKLRHDLQLLQVLLIWEAGHCK